jgi:anti-sigma factor ChrR (cupin superfamily)
MSSCDQTERVCAYALQMSEPGERAEIEAHLAGCASCRQEIAELGPVADALVAWPTDVLRPTSSLQDRLARRIADETGELVPPPPHQWKEPEWRDVAPGISCKFLAMDEPSHRVSMLVRLIPNAEYPPHTHAGVEELHLLDGELWIDDRKLYPGDYNRAERGTGDKRVWSETGCTCLLITSTQDVLG